MKLQWLREWLTGLIIPVKGFLKNHRPAPSLARFDVAVDGTMVTLILQECDVRLFVMAVNNNEIPVSEQIVQAAVNWHLFFPRRCVYQISAQLPQHVDHVGYVDNVSVTLPWDSGQLCNLELCFTHHARKNLRHLPSNKLHQLLDDVLLLWDPGSSCCRPAWGQAGFQGRGNVTDCATWVGRGGLWAGFGSKMALIAATKDQELEERREKRNHERHGGIPSPTLPLPFSYPWLSLSLDSPSCCFLYPW